jgi:hypothetical protein
MAAIIKRPSFGDNATNPVAIEIEYDFASATTVTGFVDTDHDAGTSLNLTGVHTASVTTTRLGPQTVSIKDGATVLDSQNNVNIQVAGPLPIEIDVAVQEHTDDGGTVLLVKGKCNPATVPDYPFVVCVVYSINPANANRRPVTIGADVPADKDKKWQVKLKYFRKANLRYVVRSFLVDYGNPFTIVGATTKSI